MDSNELAAFAATTEKTERKKRMTSTKTAHYRDFSFLISFLSILFDFVIFTPPNQNFFFTSICSEIYYTFCFEN